MVAGLVCRHTVAPAAHTRGLLVRFEADRCQRWRREVTPTADSWLSSVHLSSFGLRREPPRPVDDRQPGYESLFDYDTLFYDVFRGSEGKTIVCLGPPLLNCEPVMANAVFRADEIDSPLESIYIPPRLDRQPSCRFVLSVPQSVEANSISIEAAGRTVTVPVQPSAYDRFRDQRVVMTMIKDTPLQWIRDWAQFNVRIHGAQSIIIYDNGSSAYRVDDIRACLDEIGELLSHLVLSWDFPYGPGVGPRNKQDSYYCQPGALDHVRRRYLAFARAVLNCDIDELVVGPLGQSVFEEAERSGRPGLRIHGRWVEAVQGLMSARTDRSARSADLLRHEDCIYAQRKQSLWKALGWYRRLLRTKWIAVPARCSDRVAWTVHDLVNIEESDHQAQRPARSRRFVFRHFRQLTTGSNPRRRYYDRYMPIKHVLDRELVSAFYKAFKRRPTALGLRLPWSIGLTRGRRD